MLLTETSEELMLKKLKKFYNIKKNFDMLLQISDNKYAKRVIEWFVTNYSKEHTIKIKVKDKTTDVYSDYKSQLKIHSKVYFDPFRRNCKFQFIGPNNMAILTTIGQLNFFKWFIETKLTQYIFDEKFYNKLKIHMKNCLNTPKMNYKPKESPKKTKTSVSYAAHYDNILISFK